MAEDTVSNGFLRVLLALKTNVMKDTHCADIAKIKEIQSDGYVLCEVLSSGTTVKAYPARDFAIYAGDYVCVVYTDKSFTQNLAKITQGGTAQKVTSDENLHAQENAVLIGVIYGKNDSIADRVTTLEEEVKALQTRLDNLYA